VILVFASLTAISCTGDTSPRPEPPPVPPDGRSMEEIACSLPTDWLVRTARGYWPDRGGEIQLVPEEPNTMGPGLPHSGPWDHLQEVPLLWYGPGHVRAAGTVDRPVTVADIAPTQAELLGFDFHAPDGRPMSEALSPRRHPPRLVVTMVWDAGGMDVLDEWPDRWPYLRSLRDAGTWYANATVGSSPSQTAQIHATIGTGAFPVRHGLVSHRIRVGERLLAPWSENPGFIVLPTLADLYDLSMGNRPVVGEVAGLAIQLGMMGHGSMWEGGDFDLAVIRQRENPKTLGEEADSWTLPLALSAFYRLPAYVNAVGGLEKDAARLDREDGSLDGLWRGNAIEGLLGGFDTPARISYQTRVVEEVIRREGFGADRVPDLLFVNYKIVDFVSHAWSMNSPEMGDAVAWHDRSLRDFISFLDGRVGAGRWVLVLTADHGATPSLAVSGGRAISPDLVERELNRRLDTDGDDARLVEYVTHTQLYLSRSELEDLGVSPEDVARAAMTLTEGEVASEAATLPPEERDDTVFRAAYPSSILGSLRCLEDAA